MKRLWIVLLILFVAAFVGCSKAPENEVKPLVVAMELQYPPFEMSDESGSPKGISVEIAKGLAEYLKRPLKIQNTAWAGLIPSLQTGKADLVISSMNITAERSKTVNFSKPYGQSGLTLLINKNSPVQNFESLNKPNVTIAVKSGTIGAILAAEQLTNANVMSFDDVAACVLEVTQAKADVFIYDAVTVYENHKKHLDTTRVNVAAIPGTSSSWGMAIKKGNDELLAEVNAYIDLSLKEDKFDKIARGYMGDMVSFFEENKIPFFFDVNSL